MSDRRLRALQRLAHELDPELARLLVQERVRAGLFEVVAERFVLRLTTRGALWVAGGHWLNAAGCEALRRLLQEEGVPFLSAQDLAYRDVLHHEVRDRCRERARREWDALGALAVLGNRDRIKLALGIPRMPAGTSDEERRLREAWVEGLPDHYRDTDIALRSWRPPKVQPYPMGYEALVEELEDEVDKVSLEDVA